MQQLPGRRALPLVVALAMATAGSALAQDTTETGAARFDSTEAAAGAIDTAGADTSAMMDRDTSAADDTSAVGDTTDTSGVQNPPGYRGMERDTTMFPDTGGQQAAPGEAAGQTTGTYSDSAWRDTSGAQQNPPGYRGMERPVGDSAAGHDTSHESGTGAGDTTAQTPDSAQ
jgi:hypothetical protein